jgi:hypothetical protein
MNNLKHLLTVVAAWTAIAYAACYAIIALFPGVRELFVKTALHADVSMTPVPFDIGTLVVGLIFWEIIVILGVWLYAYLYKTVRV